MIHRQHATIGLKIVERLAFESRLEVKNWVGSVIMVLFFSDETADLRLISLSISPLTEQVHEDLHHFL